MSNERNILATLPFICSRTDKEYAVKVPVGEAEAFLKNLSQKAAAAEELSKELPQREVLPDVVVYFKGHCIVLANVHSKSEATIMRCVNEIADKTIFTLPEPRVRKPKTPAAPETETPAVVDEDADEDVVIEEA